MPGGTSPITVQAGPAALSVTPLELVLAEARRLCRNEVRIGEMNSDAAPARRAALVSWPGR
jgi:hypothetical protein